MAKQGAELERLVQEWCKDKTPDKMEAVVVEATGYVKGIAYKVVNPVPNLLTKDDLAQCGLIALVSRLRIYQPDKGVAFRTYCYPGVKGAMQDAVRRMSPTSRTRKSPMVSYEAISFSLAANPAYEREETIFSGLSAESISKPLVKALGALTIRQQVIILLSLNGLKSTNIANILDISPGAIRHERQLAIAKLAEILTSEATITVKEILATNGNYSSD